MASTSLSTNEDADPVLNISLPSFSITPHNYITSVGHELLNAMNTISSYGTDKNFINAINLVAGVKISNGEKFATKNL